MRIKLNDLKKAEEVLIKVLNQPIEAKVAYRLRNNVSVISEELKKLEVERVELVKKYGVQQPDTEVDGKRIPGRLEVPPEKMDEVNKEFSDLLSVEVDLNIVLFPLDCLSGLKLSAIEMFTISTFIEIPKETEAK